MNAFLLVGAEFKLQKKGRKKCTIQKICPIPACVSGLNISIHSILRVYSIYIIHEYQVFFFVADIAYAYDKNCNLNVSINYILNVALVCPLL